LVDLAKAAGIGWRHNGLRHTFGSFRLCSGDFTGYRSSEDGSWPQGVVEGSDGALYGTTESHGKNGGGTAFKLKTDGSNFVILHNFPDTEGDGQNPSASMVRGSDGAVYGMTKTCSTDHFATLFKMSFSGPRPPPAPASR
jgi:uncharacterized repeat protein (TIGR03803 family)